jgi:hypothetical protein
MNQIYEESEAFTSFGLLRLSLDRGSSFLLFAKGVRVTCRQPRASYQRIKHASAGLLAKEVQCQTCTSARLFLCEEALQTCGKHLRQFISLMVEDGCPYVSTVQGPNSLKPAWLRSPSYNHRNHYFSEAKLK